MLLRKMRFSFVVINLICLPFAVCSRQEFLPSGRTKLSAELDFWARVERDIISSFDDSEAGVKPTGPPSAIPSSKPSPVPSSKPSFSAAPTSSSAPTVTPVPTITASPTRSSKPSSSFSPSYSHGPTMTASPTSSARPSSSPKPSFSAAPTISGVPTTTPFPTYTASPTITASPTASANPTATASPTSSANPTATASPTSSANPTATASPTASANPTASARPTTSASPTASTNPTSSANPTASARPTVSASPTASARPTTSASPTASTNPTASARPTVSASPTASARPTTSASPTASTNPTSSANPTASARPTVSASPTTSARPTVSASPTTSANPTASVAPSHSSAPTATPQPTATFSPTSSSKPSFSSAPTYSSASPSSTVCEIQAEVICISEDNGMCDFVNPMGEQCIGGNAQELRFIYSADSLCGGNNTQAEFLCVDEVGTEQSRPSSVYVKAFLGVSTFYEGIVNEGNIFSVFIAEGSDSLDIEIRELTDNFGAGELLQTLTMSVRCREEDSLILLDTFGGLQLVGFRNEEKGLKAVYTDVTIQYLTQNIGIRDLFITSAFKSSPMTGQISLLYSEDKILSSPGETRIFSDILTVNLAAIVGGSGLDFGIEVKGEDSKSGDECEVSDTYTLTVTEA